MIAKKIQFDAEMESKKRQFDAEMESFSKSDTDWEEPRRLKTLYMYIYRNYIQFANEEKLFFLLHNFKLNSLIVNKKLLYEDPRWLKIVKDIVSNKKE